MRRVRIRTVRRLRRTDVRRLVPGYSSNEVLVPHLDVTARKRVHRLERIVLPHTYRRQYPLPILAWRKYRGFLAQGASLGAFDGHRLVGLALVERRETDRSLWIWEFGVAERSRGRGIGTALMRELLRRARRSGYQTVGLETQTTNVPAVDFYRRRGFEVTRVNPTEYGPRLSARGEMALFMERRTRRKDSHRRRGPRRAA